MPQPHLHLDAPILIIDDHAINVRLLELTLRREGFINLYWTTDSREAVDLCRQHLPEVLLLDLRMPLLDGYEVMGAVREAQGRTAPDVIVLTADATDQARDRALATGARAVITKPYNREDLVALVHATLMRRHRRTAA